jgi:hypothetical protein
MAINYGSKVMNEEDYDEEENESEENEYYDESEEHLFNTNNYQR